MTGRRYALVTGLVVLGGMVGGLANPARADRGALEPGARDVSLDVTGEGVVRVGQEVLYRADEPESLAGFRKRLRELVGRAGQADDVEEATLSLLAHPDVPFEVVQAILDAWRSVGRRNRLVPVELAGWPGSRSLPSGGGFYSSDGGLLPVVVSREPTGVGAATRSEPSYRLPDRSPVGAAALRSELTRIHGLYGLDQLLIVTRPGVLLSDVVSLIDILRKLGVEDVEIARRDGGLWERARARWDFLDRGEWLQSYEFLTPARRKLESLKAYVSGKQNHWYKAPKVLGVLDLQEDTAFVLCTANWTPHHHIILQDFDQEELSQQLEMVETWTKIDGEWYWAVVARANEFFAEHSELDGR